MTRDSKRRETEGFEGGVWWKGQKRVRPNACSLHRCAFGKLDRQDHRLDITGNARCKELEESREVESGREKGELSEGGVGTAEERPPWNLPLLSSSPHTTFTVSTLSMSQTPLPPPPPPQWVVALNSPMPRPSKAASSIPDPPGFSSSRGGKQVRPPLCTYETKLLTQIFSAPTAATTSYRQETRGYRCAQDEEGVGDRHRPVQADPHERHYDVHVRQQSSDFQHYDGHDALQGSYPGPD